MPPFDFPPTPAVGEVSNGYQWTGEMWSGAPKLGSDVSEQFFNLAGAFPFDIDVPAWAVAAQIDGILYSAAVAASNVAIGYLSFDGTNFVTSGYTYAGPSANSGGGYVMTPASAANYFYLSMVGDKSEQYGHDVSAFIVMRRPNTSAYFTCKSFAKVYDSLAANTYRTSWLTSLLSGPQGNALQVKKLRVQFGLSGPAFSAGSYLRVKWIGDTAQVPPSTGIADAPADGCEYVRINNIWRKKSQSFDLSGLVNWDLAVPPAARAVRIYASLMPPNPYTVSASVLLKASIDGTNFLAAATDYHYAGFIHYSGSAGFGSLSSVVGASLYLAFNNDSNIVQEVIDMRLSLVRPTVPSNQPWYGMVNSTSYQSVAANAYNNIQMRIGVMNTNAGAVTALKALRIHRASGTANGAPSYADVTWSY